MRALCSKCYINKRANVYYLTNRSNLIHWINIHLEWLSSHKHSLELVFILHIHLVDIGVSYFQSINCCVASTAATTIIIGIWNRIVAGGAQRWLNWYVLFFICVYCTEHRFVYAQIAMLQITIIRLMNAFECHNRTCIVQCTHTIYNIHAYFFSPLFH